MQLLILSLCVLCLPLVMVEGVTFGKLCSGNPTNTMRTSDRWGKGHYGAPRVYGSHEGVDIVCSDGAEVYAPFDLEVTRGLIVYARPNNKEAINNGIVFTGEGLCVKIFYIEPVKTSGTLRKGEKLGVMLSMQEVYPGITSHIHVMLCDKSDPTQYF